MIQNMFKRLKFKPSAIAMLVLSAGVVGCGSDDNHTEAQVSFMLASVDKGTCTLYSDNKVVATAQTVAGLATLQDVTENLGLALLECAGGQYKDEATGVQMTAGSMRTYIDVTSPTFNATVTPLTEIATRIVDANELDPKTQYTKVLANVADAFGLKGFDLATAVPMDLNLKEADGSAGGRYGVVLAALSQMQADIDVATADDLITKLVSGLANNGLFTSEEIRDDYFFALENMFENPLIDPNLGFDADLDALFHAVVLAPLASQVEYVDADHPESNDAEAYSKINAYEQSTFDIVGTHLSLNLTVTLAGDPCITYDLQSLTDTNSSSKFDLMFADCPSQDVGDAELVVIDHGRLVSTTTMTVVDPAEEQAAKPAKTASIAKSIGLNGSSYLMGTVTAEAPGIFPTEGAAHDYGSEYLEVFNVAGVPVDLINSSGAVLATTITDANGKYQFSNVPESTAVRVVVKAQIEKKRTVANVGPEYSFSIRDNTSAGAVKKLYQLTSTAITTNSVASSDNELNVRAKVGFDAQGIVNGQRESAPFSILRIVKSAADKLEAQNHNVMMPQLNLYWSDKNIAVWGDKDIGQIGTSHYSRDALSPGVYILGKASADTDEFDKGVIGHEFGHYLQAQLSFSDSPGDMHGDSEFKDASLAYGEGYGTAVGGLLSGSQYYCDTSGVKQQDGSCNDLTKPVPAGQANGFYSEASIIYLMYGMGNIDGKGFTEFFDAVSKMKQALHSATIFSFLDIYLKANPDVETEVKALMATSNIKTREPFGVYPANTTADPAVNATASKGKSTEGANDLEQLYIKLNLDTVAAPASGQEPNVLTSNSQKFCLNNNLKGANLPNGLGMRKRFTFTPNFTGNIVVSAFNKLGHVVSDQSAYIQVRDSVGSNVTVIGYADNYFGRIKVVSGRTYSMVLSLSDPEILLKGSQCGFEIELARSAN